MDSYLTEEAMWASGLASRLKLLQANFADDAPATRQNYITEEIDRALKSVVPARRKLHLQARCIMSSGKQSPVNCLKNPAHKA